MRCLAVWTLVVLGGCGEKAENAPPNLSDSDSPKRSASPGGIEWEIVGDKALVTTALKAFAEACPNLTKTSSSFAGGRAMLSETSIVRDESGKILTGEYTFEEFGWPKRVHIELRVSDKPTHFDQRAAGHVLHFQVGSGTRPGISVGTKVWSQQLCAVSSSDGHDPFKPVPELAGVLGEAPSDWKVWRDGEVARAKKKHALPKRRILAHRIIGKRRAAVRRSIGRALDSSVAGMDFFEPKGLDSVDVTYKDDIAIAMSINFVDDVDLTRHVDRRKEAAAWVGLPLGSDQCVNRRTSKMTISGSTIMLASIGREGSCQ